MKLFLFDIKDLISGAQYILQPGDAGIGIHLKEDNQTISTEPGIPEHRIIHSKKIVTFGVPRLLKQDQRNTTTSIATQVYNFVVQNPNWYPKLVYRPVYDVSVDDAVGLALMDKVLRDKLLISGSKLMSLLAELNEWNSNRYSFVKRPLPRLLNGLLHLQGYPFYDYPGKTRAELCEMTLVDLMEAVGKEIHELEPVQRSYPEDLKFEIQYSNDKSAMLLLKNDRYGADDLVAQEYFEYNPSVFRVIVLRRLKNTTKHIVTTYNSNIYDENLELYSYVDTKELNMEEKKAGGIPEWKNLKITALGPRRGTVLASKTIWEHSQIK